MRVTPRHTSESVPGRILSAIYVRRNRAREAAYADLKSHTDSTFVVSSEVVSEPALEDGQLADIIDADTHCVLTMRYSPEEPRTRRIR